MFCSMSTNTQQDNILLLLTNIDPEICALYVIKLYICLPNATVTFPQIFKHVTVSGSN